MEAINRHHLWYCKESYKSPLEKALRGHRAFIFPMYVEIHNDLHANIYPPQKPDRYLIHETLQLVNGLPDSILYEPCELISEVADLYIARGTRKSINIAQNLLRQSVYIAEGLV